MKSGNINDIKPVSIKSNSTGEIFTLARLIWDDAGVGGFSLIHEELPSGHRSSSPHWHSKKEELYLILNGSPTVYVNGERMTLSAGDYIAFKAGQQDIHYLTNETNQSVTFLLISTCPSDDVISYSNDVLSEVKLPVR